MVTRYKLERTFKDVQDIHIGDVHAKLHSWVISHNTAHPLTCTLTSTRNPAYCSPLLTACTPMWLQKDSIANVLDVTQDLINPMARYVEKWGAQLPFCPDEDILSDVMTTVRMCLRGVCAVSHCEEIPVWPITGIITPNQPVSL